MDKQILYFVLAGVMLLLLPLVPKMVTLRIKILRFLHLRWLADWHEKYRHGLTIALRIIISCIAVILLGLATGVIA